MPRSELQDELGYGHLAPERPTTRKAPHGLKSVITREENWLHSKLTNGVCSRDILEACDRIRAAAGVTR